MKNLEKKKWESNNLANKLYLDLVKLSLPKLLRYEDKNSMAFSIEARVPYLDYQLVEFVASLPLNQKIRNGWTKFIMRKSLKGKIPEKIRMRRSKLGFPTPEPKWLKTLNKQILEILEMDGTKDNKYFKNEKIKNYFLEFVKGKLDENYGDVFWRILNLKIWLKEFIK